MEIKEIALRRVFNLGSYETLAIELRASINEDDDVQESLGLLEDQAKKYATKGEDDNA